MSRHLFRGVAVVATIAAIPTAQASATMSMELAKLGRTTTVYSRPEASATRIALVSRLRPITGAPTVLPVLAHATSGNNRPWLRIRMPGRPNGHTGWIPKRSTTRMVTHWQLVVVTAQRHVIAYYNGRRLRVFPAVVGKPSTPTPKGSFFVEETVALARKDAGAPYALALSARSPVLQRFAGGPGQIALHGLNNIGGTLGTAASHGCLRLSTPAISWLAARIGPGMPVTIR